MLFRQTVRVFRRGYSTAITHDPAKVRNIALVAHIDSGKTTLTESILFKSAYLSAFGTVDTGSTTTDFLPAERERGITIQSASIPISWKDHTFNLIDTPGHADFGMEVESASRVVDGAVVLIDSVEGVEAQTKGVWAQLERYSVPTRMIFLNKLDRPGASFTASIASLLANRIHSCPLPITLPIASFNPLNYSNAEPGIEGIVDILHWEVWKFAKDGMLSRRALPNDPTALEKTGIFPAGHPMLSHLLLARTSILDTLAMFSDELMEKILDDPGSGYLNLSASDLLPIVRSVTLRGDVLPVLCGSAARHIGTELVLDYVAELLASPLDVTSAAQVSRSSLHLLAWKVAWDPRKGWMTFVRVYSGTLTKQSLLLNITRNQKEKVSKLLLLYANEPKEVDELGYGSVGVVLGLKHTRTGDTIVAASDVKSASAQLRDIVPPPAVMSTNVIPHSHSDFQPVMDALDSLSRTDPSVRVDQHEGQILLHGLGALHLEIVEGRLRDEWDVRFEYGRRRVSYRESLGPNEAQPNSDIWKADIGGKMLSTTVNLDVRPLEINEVGDPLWDGNIVVDMEGKPLPVSADHLGGSREAHIGRGLATALASSPHSSLAMTRIFVRLKSFTAPNNSVGLNMLVGASAAILRNRIRDAGMGPILEPYVNVKVSLTEDVIGKIVKDLTEHGGQVLDLASGNPTSADGNQEISGYPDDALYIPPGWLSPSAVAADSGKQPLFKVKRSVYAVAPLSRMLDYNTRLRALSGGHGIFELANAGFREVSENRRMEILREIGRA